MTLDGPAVANPGNEEKEVGIPSYDNSSHDIADIQGPQRDESWATRNGLTLDSFKKRSYGEGIVELDRTMQPRHLHMIAIGGSIGAGFFVGSGAALQTGVSYLLLHDHVPMREPHPRLT